MSDKGLKAYFFEGWNILELLNIVVCYRVTSATTINHFQLFVVTIVLYVKFLTAEERHQDLSISTYFPEMEQLASRAILLYNITYFSIHNKKKKNGEE